jgi:cytochrome P450
MNIARSSLAIRVKRELPPTPPLPAAAQTIICRRAPLALFDWCRRKLGDRFTLFPLDIAPAVFLSHPSDVRAVLDASSAVLHPGAGGSAIAPIVGPNSFMLREADEHLRGRRTILPAFNAAALATHTEMVQQLVAAEVASWPLDASFPVHPRLRSMSLQVILNSIFNEPPARLARLHHHLLRMLDVAASFLLVEPRLRHLPMWRGVWRRFARDRAAADEELRALIVRRRAPHAEGDALALLLSAPSADGSQPTPAQVRDNIVSLILAGHETTSAEAAWAMLLLAHAPSAQARLTSELDAGEDRYLHATVAEVLRHRPVFVFAIPRVVVAPIEIRGWTYKPPAQLLACIYLLQHDPASYPDPHTFTPERFLCDPPSASSWLPWGGGRKRCPGHRLATLELQAVIRAALATRTVAPAAAELERAKWRSVIVTPGQGGRIVLRRRDAKLCARRRVAGYQYS